MDELVGFLRARLDEDAEAAEKAAAARYDHPLDAPWADAQWRIEHGRHVTAADAHIARHDPARVLADVEAKRQIIEGAAMDLARPGTAGDGSAYAIYALAAAYADHPEFREEWKP